MEVAVPRSSTSPEFYFPNTTTPSPYQSAPSSPKPFGNPNDFYYAYTSAPTSPNRYSSFYTNDVANDIYSNDFDFSSTQEINQEALPTAEDLFDKGRIRPLTNPPPLPPRGSWSPRGRAGDTGFPEAKASTSSAPAMKSSGSRKWRLKDLFLFRSASEGRATGRGSKDPLRKYTLLSSFSSAFNYKDEVKKGGKSMEGSGSMKLHYAASRAAAEEQKKKTALPYDRNTLFGCLHFNPAVRSITRGFVSSGKASDQGR